MSLNEMQAATPWRIERNEKMHFRVARTLEDGPEYVRSASGKVSSFKTWKGAQYALRAAKGTHAMTEPQQKIEDMAHIAGCDKETAARYLMAEEWCMTDAIYSYRADKRAAAEILSQYEPEAGQ